MKPRTGVVVVVTGIIGIISLLLPAGIGLPPLIVYNRSPSMQTGFYRMASGTVRKSDPVLVRLPPHLQQLAEARGYIPPNRPLLKRLSAEEGDVVCRTGLRITINGIDVAEAQQKDALSRPMPDWQGCIVLNTDQVFLLGDDPHSFDGRYFGVVGRRQTVIIKLKK